MNKIKYLSACALVAVLFATACQKAENTNKASNQGANNAVTNAATPANTATPATDSMSSTGASTPTDAYKAAYAARKNKDVSALKKLMSKDILEFFEIMATADEKKKQSVDDLLKELCDDPQAATAEVRNEKINGDKATIEYLDKDGKWQPMEFVKEDGSWKLTIERPEKGDVEIESSPKGKSNK